tara:strand:- start:1128 stop:1421 length:294 start_codon:yes stop_codon:yes gene_type:complete
MNLDRKHLRRIILEIIKEQYVPMRFRGQGNPEGFASGIFEEDEPDLPEIVGLEKPHLVTVGDLEEQELPMGYGTAKQREKRRAAGIEGDESAFGESS